MMRRMALRLKWLTDAPAWMAAARSAGANGVEVFMSEVRPAAAEGLVKLDAGVGALRGGGDLLLLKGEQGALGIE